MKCKNVSHLKIDNLFLIFLILFIFGINSSNSVQTNLGETKSIVMPSNEAGPKLHSSTLSTDEVDPNEVLEDLAMFGEIGSIDDVLSDGGKQKKDSVISMNKISSGLKNGSDTKRESPSEWNKIFPNTNKLNKLKTVSEKPATERNNIIRISKQKNGNTKNKKSTISKSYPNGNKTSSGLLVNTLDIQPNQLNVLSKKLDLEKMNNRIKNTIETVNHPKQISKESIINVNKLDPLPIDVENKKLLAEFDPNFVKDLIKQQNQTKNKSSHLADEENYKIESRLDSMEQSIKSIQSMTANNDYRFKEKVNKHQIKNTFKPEEVDLSKLSLINDSIAKVRSEVQKKSAENNQLGKTNIELEKNYESLNNELLIYQTKLDSILNQINNFNSLKSSFSAQSDKLKAGNKSITEMYEFFKKITSDMSAKQEAISKYEEKVKHDLTNFNSEKAKLEKINLQKINSLEKVKSSYAKTELDKTNLIEEIKKIFDSYSKEEINYLRLQNEERHLELKVKEEENRDKLLSLEIDHLKALNLIEIGKNEDLKEEIEKFKNLGDYLKRDIDELEYKLKNIEAENKQNQDEYELKKNELMDKVKSLKEEFRSEETLNSGEKAKYNLIENDIKNKISYVSLQNTNLLSEGANPKQEELPFSFKSKDTQEGRKLQKQILKLLKKLNE